MLSGLLAVGLGGMLGSWLRWGLSNVLNPMPSMVPYGTLVANLVGGYIIGLAMQYFFRHTAVPIEARLFIITGFCGGLTTFSSFSAEAVTLLSKEQFGWVLVYITSHVVGSITMTIAGMWTVKWLEL